MHFIKVPHDSIIEITIDLKSIHRIKNKFFVWPDLYTHRNGLRQQIINKALIILVDLFREKTVFGWSVYEKKTKRENSSLKNMFRTVEDMFRV
jgi:hypothetical protein